MNEFEGDVFLVGVRELASPLGAFMTFWEMDAEIPEIDAQQVQEEPRQK